ncbi:MAG TPA: ATP-binding cassette domain-containing protein, partial [Pseudonocardia sp.]|nr:ATP-binding cassette domain-containing protein [Pseudonocardia sp.]
MSAPAATSTQPLVRIEAVHKHFGELQVLRGVDLEVAQGEVVCLLGPSGSGKSTLLRCINHIEAISAGRIQVGDEVIGYRQRGDRLHELSPRAIAVQRRTIGMVFQRFNLFPHRTVVQNVADGPILVRREPRAAAEQRATELL